MCFTSIEIPCDGALEVRLRALGNRRQGGSSPGGRQCADFTDALSGASEWNDRASQYKGRFPGAESVPHSARASPIPFEPDGADLACTINAAMSRSCPLPATSLPGHAARRS